MKITRNQLRGLIKEELSRVMEISSKSMTTTGLSTNSLSGGSSQESGTKSKNAKSSGDDDATRLIRLRDMISPALTKIYGNTIISDDLSDQSTRSGEMVIIKFTLPDGDIDDVRLKLADVKRALTTLGLETLKLQTIGTTSGYGDGISISIEVTVPRKL